MHAEPSLEQIKKLWHGSYRSYLIGFALCLLLTGASFGLAISGWLTGSTLTYTLIGLGALQAILQLICFLHVGQEDKPKWETLIFAFTVLILLIIVVGSLWVMQDLNERMMPNMEGMF